MAIRDKPFVTPGAMVTGWSFYRQVCAFRPDRLDLQRRRPLGGQAPRYHPVPDPWHTRSLYVHGSTSSFVECSPS